MRMGPVFVSSFIDGGMLSLTSRDSPVGCREKFYYLHLTEDL